jgi:hypothetical protein
MAPLFIPFLSTATLHYLVLFSCAFPSLLVFEKRTLQYKRGYWFAGHKEMDNGQSFYQTVRVG